MYCHYNHYYWYYIYSNYNQEYQEALAKSASDKIAQRLASAKLYEFDMMQAIESVLDSSVLPAVSSFNLDAQVNLPYNSPVTSSFNSSIRSGSYFRD